ncbi:MAG: protein-L-isoaspartate(D-aspartate) O-methyltransferase [bacterium]
MRRYAMVEEQIEARGVKDKRVLDALRKVERHKFVPASIQPIAYQDSALPIGEDQTISQPYIVASMTELLDPKPTDKVLEIGTGSGYQAAVLGELVQDVYTIEIVESLGERAGKLLQELGYDNVHVRIGDGYKGWPQQAPFDKVIVTAAPDKIPQPLIDQLKVGGRMVIPVGESYQELYLITKTENGITKEVKYPVRFVPMTGEIQRR